MHRWSTVFVLSLSSSPGAILLTQHGHRRQIEIKETVYNQSGRVCDVLTYTHIFNPHADLLKKESK